MADPRLDNSLTDEERLERLLAQQAEIQAQIASLLPSPTYHTPHRVQKQRQQQRSHVPRSMSSSGPVTMARTPPVG